MNNDQKFKTFLNLGSKEFNITVFDDNQKIIYEDKSSKEKNLNEFLDKNIYKIEKLTNDFIKKINLVVETDEFISIKTSIKKNFFGKKISDIEMKHMLFEIREQIKENNRNKSIIHILIEKYVINGQPFQELDQEIKCHQLSLEMNFICLSNEYIKNLNSNFRNYQITINRVISANYANSFFNQNNLGINELALKIFVGENTNEVQFIPKNSRKMGFFEKFFNMFN
tara:strand:- start:49 stop:726 length:678 start_codon:yes stop_codon:yes gene_type:complete